MNFAKLILSISLLISAYNLTVNATIGDIIRGTTDTAADVVEGAGEFAGDVVDDTLEVPSRIVHPRGYYRDGRYYSRDYRGDRYYRGRYYNRYPDEYYMD